MYAHQIPCGKDRDGGTFGEHHWDSLKKSSASKSSMVFSTEI